jgi:NADH dehydrogenase [ubiquinone] 1 alpha subcomplex assembly factor 7
MLTRGRFLAPRSAALHGNSLMTLPSRTQAAATTTALATTTARPYHSLHHSDFSTPDRGTVLSQNRKEFKTDFAALLLQRIHMGGYLPLSQFMKEALTHPEHGYYSTKKKVIGGENADFITAAEIPFFGDVLCGWIIDTWQKMGTPRVLHLVELGPGRGTLMLNILRQMKHLQPQLLNFLSIHLVDAGAERQEEQKKALAEFQTANGRIRWWMSHESLPMVSQPTIFIANEYFDALPITRYQYTERGWVETLVDADEDETKEAHFKFVHAPGVSFANFIMPDDLRARTEVPMGDTVEVCSAGMAVMENLAKRMVDCGKSALLIIDYGKDEHMKDTLRGIRGHKFVNPLISPGDVDLSAWVSFKQLRWALERMPLARERLTWHSVVDQGAFLEANGIDVRLASALKDQETKLALRALSNFRRLVEPNEMGTTYKVFCVQTKTFPNVSPW